MFTINELIIIFAQELERERSFNHDMYILLEYCVKRNIIPFDIRYDKTHKHILAQTTRYHGKVIRTM